MTGVRLRTMTQEVLVRVLSAFRGWGNCDLSTDSSCRNLRKRGSEPLLWILVEWGIPVLPGTTTRNSQLHQTRSRSSSDDLTWDRFNHREFNLRGCRRLRWRRPSGALVQSCTGRPLRKTNSHFFVEKVHLQARARGILGNWDMGELSVQESLPRFKTAGPCRLRLDSQK